MRIWSLHPQYLDSKGLVALWRETLLAKHVLEGKTKGYKNHPQLIRFKKSNDPLNSINAYLSEIYHEAERRGYQFNKEKIDWDFTTIKLKVTEGQMAYETKHLLNKLKERDRPLYEKVRQLDTLDTHPIFKQIAGPIEAWEII